MRRISRGEKYSCMGRQKLKPQIHISPDAETLATFARDWLVKRVEEHRASHSTPFSLALSGGSTPKRLYQLLGELPAGTIDWSQVLLIWGDERNVPADHADSNFRMVKESLLEHISMPAENVLAVPSPGESAEAAAAAYEELLRSRLSGGQDRFPVIDGVLLGMGDDVHTASLFPGTAALEERERLVVANHVPKLDCWRITLTAPFLNAARNIAFLLSGSNKQTALAAVWHGPRDSQQYPSQLIRPSQGTLWFLLDQAAAGDVPLPTAASSASNRS